jgi:transcriptional regulator with XRE-family HTH domain
MARPAGHALNESAFDDLLALKGLSITELAERSGVPRPTISGLRGGFQKASVPACHRIAIAMGVQASTLFPTLLPKFGFVATEAEVAS